MGSRTVRSAVWVSTCDFCDRESPGPDASGTGDPAGWTRVAFFGPEFGWNQMQVLVCDRCAERPFLALATSLRARWARPAQVVGDAQTPVDGYGIAEAIDLDERA